VLHGLCGTEAVGRNRRDSIETLFGNLISDSVIPWVTFGNGYNHYAAP
jgi:hypothetical protein